MEIQITTRHAATKTSDGLKQTIMDELAGVEKFYDKITSCHVILDSESTDKTVEIVMNVQSHTVTALGKAEKIGKALDEALEKVSRQLKKINEKVKSHKATKPEYDTIVPIPDEA